MKRCVIVGGAGINNYGFIKSFLSDGDFFIYCDSGLRHMRELPPPDLVVGDFDSFNNPHLPVETIVLPTVKDDTDTVYAVSEALRRGFDDFLLVGVIGGRLDHTLGNVYILPMLFEKGIHAQIVDDFSQMEMVGSSPAYVDGCRFFSLLNITGRAEKINIKNAKYELTDAVIPNSYQYGVSNEVLPGKTAEITVGEGCLLLVRVYKEQGEI